MILVTGADGFVGLHLCNALFLANVPFKAATRQSKNLIGCNIYSNAVGDIDANTDWGQALHGCSTVIHLAARAHVLHEESRDPAILFRNVNVDGALSLARAAVRAGVKRFVFVSSIGVLGNKNSVPFDQGSMPNPQELYAISKLDAENSLKKLAGETGLELVIVRPPLIYGPGNPGNFLRLLKLLSLGLPLPFSSIVNLRSFVGVENLSDFLIRCAQHPLASGETFLIADGEDVSLPDLLRGLAVGLGIKARLFAFPLSLMLAIAGLLGKRITVEKLFSGLRVDAGYARNKLDWKPPVPLQEGLQRTGDWYRKELK
ncbi:MAG: dependent epimerase/dehydratase family protein [Proteobacteria bacterium]|nr:dependent epimerase/dehydratase family protein [Pseudomonadota bacterium]